MLTVTKEEFKAKADDYFQSLKELGEPILVKDNGVDVARLEPIQRKNSGKSLSELFPEASIPKEVDPKALEEELVKPLEEWEVTDNENW